MDKIFFQLIDINNDLITHIDGDQLPEPTSVIDYIYGSTNAGGGPTGNFWVEQDTAGMPVFCTSLAEGTNMVLTLSNNSIPYLSDRCDFIKDHPIHRPK